MTPHQPTETEIEAAFQTAHGRVFARLVRMIRDCDAVEDATQEAWLRALEHWPRAGIPDQPAA